MAVYRRFTPETKGKEEFRIKRDEIQETWELRIMEAEAVRDKWKDTFGVEALEMAYYGHQKPDNWSSPGWFTINLIFSAIKVLKRNICPREIKVDMELTRAFVTQLQEIRPLEAQVAVREAIVQYFVDALKLPNEGRLAYLNALWQFGCLKVGYSADMEDNPNAGAPVMDEEGKVIFDPLTGLPQIEPAKRPKTEEFFIDNVDPDCVLVDKLCGNDPDKSGNWIAHKFFSSIQDLQEGGLYPDDRTDGLRASALEKAEEVRLKADEMKYKAHWQTTDGSYGSLPENDIVVCYEIYDLKRKQMLTIARGADKPLQDPEPIPPGIGQHPFIFLKFDERRDSFYPVPYIFNWVGPQLEYNLTRNQFALHRKRFNRKYVYDWNKIDPDEVEKLEVGDDGTFARVSGPNAVEAVKDAPLDGAVYFDTKQFRDEFLEQSGVGQLQRAVTGAESATEAEIVERRARESEVDDSEEYLAFLSKTVQKLDATLEANLTQEGAVKYTGPAGARWIPFGPEHFDKVDGEVIYKVKAEKQTKMTAQVERAQMLQLLDVLGKNPMLALSDVLLRELFDKFPAFAGNEVLIQHVQMLAMAMMGIQMGGQGQQNPGQTAKIEQSTTGGEAEKSRRVGT